MKKTIIRTGLETLYFTGLHHMMRPLVGGVGTILTLHHVRPPRREVVSIATERPRRAWRSALALDEETGA